MDGVSERPVSPLARRQHGAVHHARRPAERRRLGFCSKTAAAVSGRLLIGGGFFRLRTGPDRETPVVDPQFGYRTETSTVCRRRGCFSCSRRPTAGSGSPPQEGSQNSLTCGDEHRRFRSYTKRNGLSYFDITALNEDLGRQSLAGHEQRRRDEADARWLQHVRRAGWHRDGECSLRGPRRSSAFRGNVLGDVAHQCVRRREARPIERRSADLPSPARAVSMASASTGSSLDVSRISAG